MTATYSRRIVTRVVMAGSGLLMLPVGYVGSVAALCFAMNHGVVSPAVANWPVVHAFTLPLAWYVADVDRPGPHTLHRLMDSANKAGRIVP